MKRIVVKLGTSVLTSGSDRLNRPRMVDLIRQISQLMQAGTEVALVTSGAVLAGWEHLGFPPRKRNLPEKQFLAAVGQSQLMHLYTQLAQLYGISVAQTLLIRSDFSDRRRYLNARNTFANCFERGVLPIVNENDVVAVDEIRVGDNDTLAAHVASLLEADLLVICSDIDGLYTAAPQSNPDARRIEVVQQINDEIWNLAGGAGTAHGTGGMWTKIQAADLATRAGIEMQIVNGAHPDILLKLSQSPPPGTRFLPVTPLLEARKRWILAETVKESKLIVDDGARQALSKQGKSLLSAGISQIEGQFEKGQTVRVFDKQGQELARGLCRYSSNELQTIAGHRSNEIEALLGYSFGAEVIHRNDMLLMTGSPAILKANANPVLEDPQ